MADDEAAAARGPSQDSFRPATGHGPAPEGDGTGRAAEVTVAYEGLLQIRRVTNGGPGDTVAAPARWERLRPVRAVALTLEAAGAAASGVDAAGLRTATGYAVREGARPGTVVVEWLGPRGSGAALDEEAELRRCAGVLGRHGWEALLYRGPRRHRYLEVEPADAGPRGRRPGP